MYPFLFGTVEAYQFLVQAGSVAGIIAFVYILFKETKDYKQVFCNLLVQMVIILVGKKAAEILRTLNTQGFIGVTALLRESEGSHFLGRVLFVAWTIPWVYALINKVLDKRFHLEYKKSMDAVAFYFVIQHIFNRIAYFCNGCCYGKRYFGIGSIAYQDVGSVYPSQLIELTFMCITFALLCMLKKKNKPIYGVMLVLFGISIFISEFFMDQAGILLFAGMNVIQYASLMCIVTGIIYQKKKGE